MVAVSTNLRDPNTGVDTREAELGRIGHRRFAEHRDGSFSGRRIHSALGKEGGRGGTFSDIPPDNWLIVGSNPSGPIDPSGDGGGPVVSKSSPRNECLISRGDAFYVANGHRSADTRAK